MRRLEGVEPLLRPVDMLAGSGEGVLGDPRLRALSVHVADAVRPLEKESSVADRVFVAVEGANRRAGRAVALVVVGASVTGAGEARQPDDGNELDELTPGGLLILRLAGLDEAAGLDGTAELRTAFGDDRDAGLPLERPVVAQVRRPPAHLALLGIEVEVGDHPLPLREVGERPQVDRLVALLREGGDDREADGGHGHDAADDAAEAERGAFEELRPWIAGRLSGRRLGHGRAAFVGRDRRRCGLLGGFRFRRRRWRDPMSHGDVADPQEAEKERYHRADRDRGPADDEADQNADDANGEPDRPHARRGRVRLVATRRQLRTDSIRLGAALARIERHVVLLPATIDEPLGFLAHLDFLRPLACSLFRPFVRRVYADLAAVELSRGSMVEVIERPF